VEQRDAAPGQRLPADLDQRFGPSHPAALSGGEQDPGDRARLGGRTRIG
jgi:hypothetical protein